MKEIGSEFWQEYSPSPAQCAENEAYLLSGRTALRYILDDIRRNGKAQKALLPSYYCDSMIIPFLQAGIDVTFYPVHCDSIDYPYGNDADIVFLIDYFGYVIDQNYEIACHEKQKGKIIIYDSTHKLDGNHDVGMFTDYTFCSYRKWFFCNYAKAVKHHGAFNVPLESIRHKRYVQLREVAAREKARYMAGAASDKQRFLSDFGAAEEILDEDYAGYVGIPVDVDLEAILAKRNKNADYLIRELKEIPQIRLWRDNIGSEDAPMFVPVLIDPCIRSDLRTYLISRKIYCPIHWPLSPYHTVCNELYDMELSLVCDQRYDYADMERMVCAIKEYFADKR